MKQFYDDIKNKRNIKKTMRLQVDNKYQQVKIKDLNDENSVEMFMSSVRGGRHLLLNKKYKNSKAE